MTEDSPNAVWYCVVVRDSPTGRYQHYRCFWNQHDAELYKLQLEQAGDCTEQSSAKVTIETLPGGELPQRTIS
jgi:hypothetical protein